MKPWVNTVVAESIAMKRHRELLLFYCIFFLNSNSYMNSKLNKIACEFKSVIIPSSETD